MSSLDLASSISVIYPHPRQKTCWLKIDLRGQKAPGSMALPVAVRDVKDEKILASAIAGAADYLVTGDADLLTLNGDPALGMLKIVTVRDFLDILSSFS